MRVVPARGGARRLFAGTAVATFLVQCAWILALPAFHGIDEFDHVYRAAAAASGQLLPPVEQARHGRGGVVHVPAAVVAAAGPVCSSYSYTGPDNCRPIRELTFGRVDIATAAASYNPSYYVIAGLAAAPFSGAAYDYALRLFTALVCSLLLAWAAVVTARWARDGWPALALAAAVTPTLLYSTSIAAPNGIEYTAAALFWTSGIAWARDSRARPLVPLVVSAVLMAAMHTTGTLWLLVAACAVVMLRPVAHWRESVSAARGRVLAATAAAAVGVLGCAAWVLLAHTNAPGTDGSVGPGHPPSLPVLLVQNVLWPLQALAAFPMRDQPAPTLVYAALLVPLTVLVVLGWRSASARTRWAMGWTVALTVVVPTFLTWSTYAVMGTAWQGRYTLPLYVGVPLLAAHALTGRRRVPVVVRSLAGWLVALATTVAIAHVGRVLVTQRPGTSIAQHLPAGWLLAALLGGLASLWLVRTWLRGCSEHVRDRASEAPGAPGPSRAPAPVDPRPRRTGTPTPVG